MSMSDVPSITQRTSHEFASDSSDDGDDGLLHWQPVVAGPRSILRSLVSHGRLTFREDLAPLPSFDGFIDPDEPRQTFGAYPRDASFPTLSDIDVIDAIMLGELEAPRGRPSVQPLSFSDHSGILPTSVEEHHDVPRHPRLRRLPRLLHYEGSTARRENQRRTWEWALTPSTMSTRVPSPSQESLQTFDSCSRSTTSEDLGMFLTDDSTKYTSEHQQSETDVSGLHDNGKDSANVSPIHGGTDEGCMQVAPPADPVPALRRPLRRRGQMSNS